MTTQQLPLETKPMEELVALHNLIADKKVGPKAFNSRAKAVARIQAIADKKKIDLKALVAGEAKAEPAAKPKPTAQTKPTPTAKPTAQATPVVKGADGKPIKRQKVRIIRVAAEELLLQDDPALSYEEILEKIKEEFPKAQTTISCLRWYAVHMRERGEKLPNRPRPPRGE